MSDRREQIKLLLKKALEDNLSGVDHRAFIFGSQANRQELILADIDLGIMTNAGIPLNNLARIHNAIEEMPMLYKVDLVDFNDVDDKFRSVALQNMEWL